MSTPLPNGIDLDQYRTQAKELLRQARAADPAALERLRTHHPEHDRLLASGRIQLADAQLTVARENGFGSWPKFQQYVLFRNAVDALDSGDVPLLDALLERHPELIRYRCHHGEWYESGYFAGAQLLHHIAGNPIRRPLPRNILDVARLLLVRGADPATTCGEPGNASDTIGLLLTGSQASEAGVAVPLIDLLTATGARMDVQDPELLTSPLLNGAPETAEALRARGAHVDVRHAAALGLLDDLEALLVQETRIAHREEALVFASIRGQTEAARLLVRHGARGDVLVSPGGATPRTALHEAANRGHAEIVRLLLDSGADPSVVEPHWGGTPAGWADHGGHPEIAAPLRR